MLLILLLFFVALIQVLGYVYFDQKGWHYWKLAIPLIFIPIYIFVIAPAYLSYQIPKKENGELGCGMPALGLFLFTVIIGISGLLITHLLYWLFRKIKKK